MKHSSRLLPGLFVWRCRPFAYKRGVGDVTTVSGLCRGEWSYLWLTLEQKGMALRYVLSTHANKSTTTERQSQMAYQQPPN